MIFHEVNSSILMFLMNLIDEEQEVKIGQKKEMNEKAVDLQVLLKKEEIWTLA